MSDESIERDATADSDGASAETGAETGAAADAEASAARDERYEGATPPGYDEWPTHGGYLGCLLAVMFACVLAPLGYIVFGFLGSILGTPLGKFGVVLAAVVTVALYLVAFIAIARLGWSLGKRFLREYDEPARPRWGEASSEDDYPLVVEADAAPAANAANAANAADVQDASATPANPDTAPAEQG